MHEVEPTGHRVKINLGYTRNMGNFESLRVDIGIEVDGSGNPNTTFDKAYSWVDSKLSEKLAEVEEALKG